MTDQAPTIYAVYSDRFVDSYWLSLPAAKHRAETLNAELTAEQGDYAPDVVVESYPLGKKIDRFNCAVEFVAGMTVYNQAHCVWARNKDYPT